MVVMCHATLHPRNSSHMGPLTITRVQIKPNRHLQLLPAGCQVPELCLSWVGRGGGGTWWKALELCYCCVVCSMTDLEEKSVSLANRKCRAVMNLDATPWGVQLLNSTCSPVDSLLIYVTPLYYWVPWSRCRPTKLWHSNFCRICLSPCRRYCADSAQVTRNLSRSLCELLTLNSIVEANLQRLRSKARQ